MLPFHKMPSKTRGCLVPGVETGRGGRKVSLRKGELKEWGAGSESKGNFDMIKAPRGSIRRVEKHNSIYQ